MRSSFLLSFTCLWALGRAVPRALKNRDTDAPTVDLGYEVHQATFNSTGNYYIFSNVPYAEQPVGDLRFEKPVAPSGSSSAVNNGSTDAICVQAYPEWIVELQAQSYGVDVATMRAILYSAAGQTESCLVLDVYVPADIFNTGSTANAPVMVWIHGGGFTYGGKSNYDPAGLIAQSQVDGSSGVIVVVINYRLGVYGWLAEGGITPNLGLFDQLRALDWVTEYIYLFGGSPSDVTAIGESAGAASILHHLTSYGGDSVLPFSKAILESPAFQFNLNQTAAWDLTLAEATTDAGYTVDDTATLKALDESTLKTVNENVVYSAGVGQFIYGPGPDGTYVPKLPQVLLAEGKFNQDVKLLLSHTSNESIPFTPTTIATAADVFTYVSGDLTEASNDTITTLLTTVYPDVLDGTYPWWSEYGRAVQINTEANFACSTRFLSKATASNATYNLIFAYPPGYHAQDVPYVFFNGDTTTTDDGLPVNAALAEGLQQYFTSFAKAGVPSASGQPDFPVYGSAANVLELTYFGFVDGTDDMANSRCDWLQQAMVDGLI